jgi:integrase
LAIEKGGEVRGQEKMPTNNGIAAKPGVNHSQLLNHPAPGSTIRVDPIRRLKDVALIKKVLADRPRDFGLFVFGINTNLRASDLLRINVGDVRHLGVGESFVVREQKTGKLRRVTINATVHAAVKTLLTCRPDACDEEFLFLSQKTGTRLTVSSLNKMVKGWCRQINLPGNYGAHTLRKTWGFMMRTQHGIDVPTLMTIYNHATQRQTLAYLGIQETDVQECYLKEI